MTKPSVLIINRAYPPDFGATGQMAYDLVRHLSQKGHRVGILTTGAQAGTEKSGHITIYRVKAVKSHKKWYGFLVLWLRLWRKSSNLKYYDVVISLTDPPMLSVIGAKGAKKNKARHIHWCHDVYPDLFSPLGVKLPNFILSKIQVKSRQVMKKCDTIVTVSHCMAKHLDKTGVTNSDLRTIPNWSATEFHHQLKKKAPKVVEKNKPMLRDDSAKFRVLYAGHIGRSHVVKPIIDACEILKDNNEIEFTFVNQKDAHEQLSHERSKRELHNLKLVPLQPLHNIAPIIESGDIHLVSMRENVEGLLLPCKFFAALAVARPVIFVGPSNNDIADIITTYKMGTIISPDDAQGLAEAIYHYRMDSNAWFIAQEGAIEAAKKYNAHQSLKMWDALINEK